MVKARARRLNRQHLVVTSEVARALDECARRSQLAAMALVLSVLHGCALQKPNFVSGRYGRIKTGRALETLGGWHRFGHCEPRRHQVRRAGPPRQRSTVTTCDFARYVA
jgi:hypothetical protein